MSLLKNVAVLCTLLPAAAVADYAYTTVPQTFLFSIRSPRPSIAEASPARNRTCIVESHGDGETDDSEFIKAAIDGCNPDGHVIFPSTQSYFIGNPLDLTHLERVDLDIQAFIKFSDNMTYWRDGHTFDMDYQNSTTFFKIGGTDVNVYGGGVIDGNGQKWWDWYPEHKKDRRPVLLMTDDLHGGTISDISLNNSPMWTNFVANSTDVTFTNISIWAVSNNEYFEKNTDGWDVYRSDRITIQNSSVTNGDGNHDSQVSTSSTELADMFQTDCVSFKPNSTNILVQNMRCNGTHGISIGSLGQYPERVDYVQNITVINAAMYNSSEGARIKVWPDAYSEKSGTLSGGGGRGLVQNVTYDTMWLDNVDYGLTITQCYGQDDEEECFKHPVSKFPLPEPLGIATKSRCSQSSRSRMLLSATLEDDPTVSLLLLWDIWFVPAPTPVPTLLPRTSISAPLTGVIW